MKIYRRLGAAIGVMALLAGGLVGVAAPSQALHGQPEECFPWIGNPEGKFLSSSYPSRFQAETFVKGVCEDRGYGKITVTPLEERDDGYWYAKAQGTKTHELPTLPTCQEGFALTSGGCVLVGLPPTGVECGPNELWNSEDEQCFVPDETEIDEPVQKRPPPPPCWSGEAGNNCPVGGALTFSAPKYAMVGVPVTIYAFASWRPDPNSPAQPTQGTAVIRVDGEDYSGVAFEDGVAEWTFIPKEMGEKNFTVSGVVSSGLSGANAYIDSVPASTYVVPYDPEFLSKALKDWRVDIGEKFVITDREQALSHAKKRYKWSVAPKSEDVCAVYKTKKREIKAKFNDYGKCTVRWLDRKSAEEGKYTFIVTKPKLNID